MGEYIFEVEVCQAGEFDRQSAILFTFDNWEEAQSFIKLALQNSLIILVESVKKTEE